MHRTARRWITAGLVSTTVCAGLAACGTARPTPSAGSTASLAPQDAFQTGARALLAGHDLSVIANLQTSPATLVALSKDPTDDEVEPMPLATAKAIATGFVRFSLHDDKGLPKDVFSFSSPHLDPQESRSVLVHAGDGAEAELLSVKGALYGRADVSKLVALSDADSGTTLALAAAAGGVGIPAEYRDVVKHALAGDWIRIDADTAAKSLSLLQSVPDEFSIMFDQSAFMRAVLGAAAKQLSYERVSASGPDDHLRATVKLADLESAVNKAGEQAFGSASGDDGSDGRYVHYDDGDDPNTESDAPDRSFDDSDKPATGSLTIDAVTHDGVLSDVTIDLSDAASGSDRSRLAGGKLLLHLTFNTAPVSISAPPKSTAFDPTKLTGNYVDMLKSFQDSASDDPGSCSRFWYENQLPTPMPSSIPDGSCGDGKWPGTADPGDVGDSDEPHVTLSAAP